MQAPKKRPFTPKEIWAKVTAKSDDPTLKFMLKQIKSTKKALPPKKVKITFSVFLTPSLPRVTLICLVKINPFYQDFAAIYEHG